MVMVDPSFHIYIRHTLVQGIVYVVCVVADMHLAAQVDVFDPLQAAISTRVTPPPMMLLLPVCI